MRNLAQLKIYGDPATQRTSSEKHYKPISSAKLEKRLFSGFEKAGIVLTPYYEIAADCDAPDKSKFDASFATKGSFPSRIRRAAYKAVQTCEIKYFMIVTLTLDGLSEREKGRFLFEAKANVYDVSKRRNRIRIRTIASEWFKGHSAGARIRDAREAVFEKVTAKLVGGKVAGSNKVYKGELLQRVRNKLEAKQRALAEAKQKAAIESQHDLGYKAYEEEKDNDKALRILKPLAIKGHGESQYYVGMIYYRGPAKTGPEQDYKKAMKWFKKLAENVNADPFSRMTVYDYITLMYQVGQGVPKSTDLMIKWSKKGVEALAEHKEVKTLLFNLGLIYEGINNTKAYMWYTLGEHYTHRNQLAKKMNPIQIALAKKLAAECVAKKYKGC